MPAAYENAFPIPQGDGPPEDSPSSNGVSMTHEFADFGFAHSAESYSASKAWLSAFGSSGISPSSVVLVQPEMERGRFPLVSNPPFRARLL